ncbi:uncharacterized protein LOC116851100 [Odontomachus brunneus]|uniref:uncharacterized protein LOC116851100 n=1 Tax=Odontomachus brunneus TaxID=486640 RepID=UPI0013F21C83|nr:uncharacterized protein LOC116851100 [Odontomachus brunneus]
MSKHHNSPINFYEVRTSKPQTQYAVQRFAPQTFAFLVNAPQMPVPRMPVPQTFKPRMPVPRTFEPQGPLLQTFTPQTFTPHIIQINAPRAILPQSIILQPIVPQAIAPRTIMPQTFAPRTVMLQTSQVVPPASSMSMLTIITPQQSHAIQHNNLQSSNLVYAQKSQNTSKLLTSIWMYDPELLPIGHKIPVTISTPWYGANWEIMDPYDMDEIYAKSSHCVRDPFSHVRANTMRKSNTAAYQLSVESMKSLWKVPITQLYEAYTLHKPQHQSEMSETLSKEQQMLMSQDSLNLNINELIPTFQMEQ